MAAIETPVAVEEPEPEATASDDEGLSVSDEASDAVPEAAPSEAAGADDAASFDDRMAKLRGELQGKDDAEAAEETEKAEANEETRFLEPEPQAGRPDYADDENAYDDPHQIDDQNLEPYGEDEEPVVYEDTPEVAAAPPVDAPTPAMRTPGLPTDDELAHEEYQHYEDDEADAATPAAPSAEVQEARQDQMDEIRQMLDELQTEDVEQEEGVGAYGAVMDRPDPIPSRPYEEDEYRDPLRERLAEVSGGAASGLKKNVKQADYDRSKMMKKHQRRYKRKRTAELSRRPSPFATGFMLMIMVATLMGMVYLLHPQIIARVPESEPALLDYVQFIDGLRVVVGEKVDVLRGMLDEAIEKAA